MQIKFVILSLAETPPEQCPSCKKKCEFLDTTCYTPDCKFEGVDKRIG